MHKYAKDLTLRRALRDLAQVATQEVVFRKEMMISIVGCNGMRDAPLVASLVFN